MAKSLSKIFEEYINSSSRQLQNQITKRADAINHSEISAHEIHAPSPSLHNYFCPLFGKTPPKNYSIGCHPDFQDLENTDNTRSAPIVTLFMDMVGSTRLNFFYPLEDVFKIKNAILRSAIDIVTAFGGHIHRIMGDAIMAFFGGTSVCSENSVIDSLNASTSIMLFLKNVVIPKLSQIYDGSDFGIRIGIDYAPKDKIIWSSYGYTNVCEVTATSFFVDVASKLQSSASKNSIMIGQSLVEFIDLPENLLEVKSKVKNGERESIPYIKPNYTKADGTKINYKQFQFKWDEYAEITPLSEIIPNEKVSHDTQIRISADRNEFSSYTSYAPCSYSIPKFKEINFRIQSPMAYNSIIKFEVQNHGSEASQFENNANHEQQYEVSDRGSYISHWESTKYRGLHYMKINIHRVDGMRLEYQKTLGIYVN